MTIHPERIAIVGLGYVGLPLAVAFASGYKTVGFDINEQRVHELQKGFDKTLEVEKQFLHNDMLTFTTNPKLIKDCDVYIITVPTPTDSRNQPDLTALKSSSHTVGQCLKKGDYVIYESTVYPGVTEEVCIPVLEKASGLKLNVDFYCGYSPERVNPGDKSKTITDIKKVTSGSCELAREKVDRLYRSIIKAGTHSVSSIKIAEAIKVIENTQRDVNIALINELAMIFHTMNIDTKEVLEGAATKWNFIKMFPGLVGGHCIGVDPYYLTFKALENGYEPNLILAARQINSNMGRYVAQNTLKLMNSQGKVLKGAKVLLMGLTFKENCPDVRNTRVVDVIKELVDYGCHIDIYDPWVARDEIVMHGVRNAVSSPFEGSIKYDAIVVCVAHDQFKNLSRDDFAKISDGEPLVIDVKSMYTHSDWRL